MGDTAWRCRLFGHNYSFSVADHTMIWLCERGCGAGGSKEYADGAQAQHYAEAFNKRDTDNLGQNAPLIGLFPLRLWHRWKSRRQ